MLIQTGLGVKSNLFDGMPDNWETMAGGGAGRMQGDQSR
ncbi:hypothetical protein X941_5383 [Burkholderia pseudomallei MSHR5569]|nr:hypothetical protein X941_5383 [Burkholderia pseudomallei MSHR5569]